MNNIQWIAYEFMLFTQLIYRYIRLGFLYCEFFALFIEYCVVCVWIGARFTVKVTLMYINHYYGLFTRWLLRKHPKVYIFLIYYLNFHFIHDWKWTFERTWKYYRLRLQRKVKHTRRFFTYART